MKKIRLFLFVVLLMSVTGLWAQAVGDYGSNATNNAWNTASNWLVCISSGTWDGATTATVAPLATTNIWIRSGHTVTLPAGGNCLCNNLYVDGILVSANAVTSPRYVRIYGNSLIVNGTFGSATDGLGLQLYGGATQTLTVSGTATIYFSRIQPQTAAAVTFDANAQFDYGGSSGTGSTGLYANNFDFIITINEGKTVTLADNSYFAVHSSSGSSAGASNLTLYLNGTLNGSGANSAINFNAASGKTVVVNIGSKGEIKSIAPIRVNYLNAATTTINIASGGKISGLAGSSVLLSKATITNNGIISVAGSNPDSIGATIVSSTGSILVNKTSSNLAFAGTSTLNSALTFTSGTASLGANNLTVGSTGSISGSSSTSYIITNGTGKLIQSAAAATPKLFPIGASSISYDPVILTPTNATDVAVNVGTTLPATAPSGFNYNAKVWDITPVIPSSTSITLTPSTAVATSVADCMGHYINSAYVNVNVSRTGNSYTAIFDTFSPFVTGTTDLGTALSQTKIDGVSFDGQTVLNPTHQSLNIYDVTGRLVTRSTGNINMSSKQKGIYIIQGKNAVLKISMVK